ncbi:MAG: major capsid protein [Microviridae sp.]|nr:MAG: major capsid protein [Microviridae sp.]
MRGALNRNMPPIKVDQFSMVPRSDVPRSTFRTQHSHKTTFGGGYLVPIHVDEVLPGDVHQGEVVIFARMSTLLFPLMDNVQLETFFFFVPCRLLWTNWRKFMGEQANPGDSISFTIPQVVSAAGGFPICTIFDYFGLPTVGQVGGGNTVSVNVLPLRAYNMIWQEWFRDQNLDTSLDVYPKGDGPDGTGSYGLQRRRKKHDYFTSCLPWPVKGGSEVPIPLTGSATVVPITPGVSAPTFKLSTTGAAAATGFQIPAIGASQPLQSVGAATGAVVTPAQWVDPQLKADLSTAAIQNLNAMRLAIATQQLLEKDARGGTRYTELLKNHFGVMPQDSRMQRPEYIGGGCSTLKTAAIPQTSATGLTGGTSPQGALAAQSLVADRHTFSYHAAEHGYIIGLVWCGADLTYQQGLHRLWSRSTRYDFYWPTFANLGEQAVLNKEIFVDGSANDPLVFGYQERWAEYRHRPSRISGLFRSTSAGTIDVWHAAQKFTVVPTLNTTFIADTPPFSRVLAAGAQADNMQILFDSVFTIRCTRAMPKYSVPGLSRF